MPRTAALLVLLLASTVGCTAAFLHNLQEGDSCTERDGAPGVCTGLRRCRGAVARIRVSGARVVICSYGHDGPIICCPSEPASPSQRMVPVAADQHTADTATLSPALANRSAEIAMEKCVQYGEHAYVSHELPTLLPEPEVVRELKCAIVAEELIVGGMRAERNEFAHMTALGYVDREDRSKVAWKCAGSLISERFVLTAAHCTSDTEGTKVTLVRLGTLNVNSPGNDSSPQTITVMDRIRHPMYRNPSKYNDIALLKLARPALLGLDVRPACLYTGSDNPPRHKYAVATGWGRTSAHHAENSEVLMKVRLQFFPTDECMRAHHPDVSLLSHGIINSKMICAGDPNGDKDTCMGDSGGPLQISLVTPLCMYSIVGVTSFGSNECVSSYQPGVYTRVSYFLPWIQSHVWP